MILGLCGDANIFGLVMINQDNISQEIWFACFLFLALQKKKNRAEVPLPALQTNMRR